MRRKLSHDEAALWARLAGTVVPINPPRHGEEEHPQDGGGEQASLRKLPAKRLAACASPPPLRGGPPPRAGEELRARPHTLDANWDRKLAQGLVLPDFTLDLHGHSLDAAYMRLDHGLALALAQGARLVLLITGKARPSDGSAGRSDRRGAIRAKFLDWLALGSHASKIAAIRPAHPRHGGAGAVYLVLRRGR